MSISRLLAFACIACAICGCTKTVHQPVAAYYPGTFPTTQPVPKTAVYSIRFLDENGKKTGGIFISHRLLAAGENAGFDIDEDHGIIAVAGTNWFPITIPPGYGAIWSATYQKKTQFAKEVSKAGKMTGKAAGYVANGAVESLAGDDDEDGDSAKAEEKIRQQREHNNRIADYNNHH